MTALFATVSRYTTEQVCGPNGCPGDGRIVADAVDDPHLGFPQQIHIWLDAAQRTPSPSWTRIQAYWDPSTLACTPTGFDEQPIRMVRLALLPLPPQWLGLAMHDNTIVYLAPGILSCLA